ncbi:MAG: hypothetical protein ABJB34_11670 [Acidobacteriota bacterium]
MQTLDGGNRKIYRVDYKTKRAELLKLPYDGSAFIGATDTNADGIYFYVRSWTKSSAYFRYDPKTGAVTKTNFIPAIPIDMSNVEVVNANAKSYDGTMIPLVIIYKRV